MSNDPEQEHGDFAHLEPLPDLPQEVPAFAPAAAEGASAARGARPNAGQSPASLAARALEKAPQLLKKAARILVLGSLLPWMGVSLEGSGGLANFGWKLALLAGCWILFKGLNAHYQGGAATGFGTKPVLAGRKGMLGALNGLHLVGTALIVAVLFLQFMLVGKLLVLGESLSLLLGGLTFIHIVSYEKGGKFNPLFPLMFLGCAVGGLAALVGRIQNISSAPESWLAAIGCAMVTAAGVLAVYTIAVAMMQAKKDGDLKKAAAIEARKQARGPGRPAPSREPS